MAIADPVLPLTGTATTIRAGLAWRTASAAARLIAEGLTLGS